MFHFINLITKLCSFEFFFSSDESDDAIAEDKVPLTALTLNSCFPSSM